ncbi:CAP-associated domain-containing protein [Romboutsia sp. 1001216sp1]|uniref:CAP domain-containing protein n=1 Tax=Romboutsia TaxID=1501226 RepID=UPI000AC2580F|nr:MULTISPECIES: CAP-associated domain-containing protein [Romboutsia]MDB8790946.1 CAP-associated domain-containing protein [Romboutsia sp. 1001216sp1]MDB8793640.1 CAP-associated domain-containing protein [Romboutsia sp. 1001216sp1]MDB8795037.1 CAP-associated domain-containing protein [Romboutsia sp. 1001216sp1]MDB8798847.1 CAP-associated domain-containing protein [Romboutsia sp. 1001216sp1]MDB8801650.1 CAP-associated domain-containing protein [Romboutsia sp. 1001216sp1]
MKSILLIGGVITSLLLFNLNIDNSKKEIDANNNVNNKSINISNTKDIYNIKIGERKEKLLSLFGQPDRIDESEYGFNWYIYNNDYNNFFMVGIEDEVVKGIYSNSLNSCETENINIGDKRDDVRKLYTPIEYKKKGNIKYIINSEGQYDIIEINNKYITFFYDIHDEYKICSYQVIDSKNESDTKSIYASPSEKLKKSFEMQVIDLTNSVRAKNGLNKLKYSEMATTSSKKHSLDMVDKNYFDHINKENETPFDRMNEEGIKYISAGENIAAGQTSAIHAHEALMNSKGHRKNILGNYNSIGVGVEFGGDYNIYYTQNFYR